MSYYYLCIETLCLKTHNGVHDLPTLYLFRLPLKAIIAICIVTTVSIGIFLNIQSDKKEVCIEDWYAQTSQLFQSASGFFSSNGTTPHEADTLDAKLQALLPSDNMDLSYHSNEVDSGINPLATGTKQALLPNLFNPTNDPSTQIKGQVFTDEKDNIVGAELNLSIPADIR